MYLIKARVQCSLEQRIDIFTVYMHIPDAKHVCATFPSIALDVSVFYTKVPTRD